MNVKHKLDIERKALIDTGLRHNPLLHFKIPAAKGVAVTDIDASDLFTALVSDEKSIPIVPDGYRGSKLDLRTPYEEEVLQKRLFKTQYDARTYLEERGINVLYIAVGMLHWFESRTSDVELRAPLILIPVVLSRTPKTDTYTIKYSNEEIEQNLALATRLQEFGIHLPQMSASDDLDVDAYLSEIHAAVKEQSRWSVNNNEVALSLFSFANTFMYRDLQPENWCTQANPEGSPLISGLLVNGFRDNLPTISEDEYLDKYTAPDKLRQVVDSDSSQTLAMLDVQRGKNLIIQGPPGTGKSQTITNIIADAVASGKSVLFVAEKSAALEVVKRRLVNVGLGDLCLELHSHSANKRHVLEELRRTHDLGKPKTAASWSLSNYKEYRDTLNAHCLALNTPVQGTSWTPQQAMGKLAAIRSTSPESQRYNADVAFDHVRWTADELARKRRAIAEASNLLQDIGSPSSNPFALARLQSVLPIDQDAIYADIDETLMHHSALKHAVHDSATLLGLSSDLTITEIEWLAAMLRNAFDGAPVYGLRGSRASWTLAAEALRELIAIGAYATSLRQEYSSVVNDTAWDHDCTASRAALQQHGSSWLRWFSSTYRMARRDVRSLTNPSHDFDDTGRLQILNAITEYQQRRSAIQTAPSSTSALLGSQWRGIETAWEEINTTVEKVLAFASASKHELLDEAIWQYAIHHSDAGDVFRSNASLLQTLVDRLKARLQSLAEKLELNGNDRDLFIQGNLNDIGTRLDSMSHDRQGLQRAVRWNRTKYMLTKEQLSWVVQLVEQHHVPADILDDVFLMNVLTPILRQARQQRPILEAGGGDSMNTIRQQFTSLDTDSFTSSRNEILHHHFNRIPKHTEQGQVGILYREYNKKRRHMPIRRLIEQTHSVIQAMKPVFMMSPKSIAAFLPANTITFDLVVFDEASQIRPVDAFGALLRGRQFVVVGDSMQLPPTNFFNRLLDDDGSDESEEDTSTDIESLLALANSKGVSERTLRWHYRSRHHTLIELSNSRFYQNRLNVIRSPKAVRDDLGLVMHHIPHSVYDRGKSRTNRIEAQEVANAVLFHARTRPDKTLGVAAFNTYQAEAILDEIEELRREHVELDSYLQSHQEEPFFCKSLENVQGDERDIIFISIGYGRDKDGYLSMALGAVNKDGGERRLNVLITRARESCHVFSNITHADIDDSQSRSSGLQALKAFLRYAESGVMDVPTAGNEEGDSPFEDEVARVLEANGFDIAKQVGSAGFRIDIAVKDPNNPSNYVLGIECDGATYHSSRSARDRDRLRQQVLENIGWRIYRIWSTDWFRDSQTQARKVIEEINHTLNLAKTAATVQPTASRSRTEVSAPKTVADRVQRVSSTSSRRDVSGVPYKTAKLSIRLGNRELHEVDEITMARWITSVVDVESPVHVDEVITRIVDAAGVKRVGSRINELFQRSVARAVQSQSVLERNDFLHKPSSDDVSVRDRSELPQSSRRFDLIANEELDAAILFVVRETYGISPDELRTTVARVLGFKRVSADIEQRLTLRFTHLQDFGKIVNDGGTIRINA